MARSSSRGCAVTDVDSGQDPVASACVDDGAEGCSQLTGVVVRSIENSVDVASGAATEAQPKICGPDVEGIDAVDFGNGLDVRDRTCGFDLNRHEGLLIERPNPPGLHSVGASAMWRISRCGDCLLGISRRLDEGHDDSSGAQVESTPDWSHLDRRHPDQPGNLVVSHDGEERGVNSGQVDSMLGVDHDEIGSYRGAGVDYRWVAGHTPEAVETLLLS